MEMNVEQHPPTRNRRTRNSSETAARCSAEASLGPCESTGPVHDMNNTYWDKTGSQSQEETNQNQVQAAQPIKRLLSVGTWRPPCWAEPVADTVLHVAEVQLVLWWRHYVSGTLMTQTFTLTAVRGQRSLSFFFCFLSAALWSRPRFPRTFASSTAT